MKLSWICHLVFLLLVSNSFGQNQPVLQEALDDLISPDEIASELGLPRTEIPVSVESIEDLYHLEGVNIFKEYALVLVINKNARGPGAQTMRVYENGVATHEWKISTGRERNETAASGRRYFSVTPLGWYYPLRLTRNHYSQTWQTDMEFAVFFNGGVAVHATTPYYYKELGTRASGGCVRLRKENAAYVYNKIIEQGKGFVPVINRNGALARDRRGNPIRSVQWKTLITVVDR